MLRRMREEADDAEVESETASIAPSELDKLDFSGTPSIKSAFTSSDGDSRSSLSKESTTSSKGPHFLHRRSSSQRSTEKHKKEDALARWLRDGTVVYKSVGLGLMDLAVGMHLVELAKEKGIGTQVDGF